MSDYHRGGQREIGPFLVGHTHPSADFYEVGREKIREYARAVKDDHPAHLTEAGAAELGYSGLIAPPTFLSMWAWSCMLEFLEAENVGMDLHNLIHTEQEFRHFEPVIARDRLRGEFTVVSWREMGPTETITVRTVITRQDEKAVAEVISTLVKYTPK